MTIEEARAALETLPEDRFQEFFRQLPERVQLLVRSGMCNWREVLPEWYVTFIQK